MSYPDIKVYVRTKVGKKAIFVVHDAEDYEHARQTVIEAIPETGACLALVPQQPAEVEEAA